MSPLELDAVTKGRHSLLAKPEDLGSGVVIKKQLSPTHHSLVIGNAHSEENFNEERIKGKN